MVLTRRRDSKRYENMAWNRQAEQETIDLDDCFLLIKTDSFMSIRKTDGWNFMLRVMGWEKGDSTLQDKW